MGGEEGFAYECQTGSKEEERRELGKKGRKTRKQYRGRVGKGEKEGKRRRHQKRRRGTQEEEEEK